jgi:hypothetical protein
MNSTAEGTQVLSRVRRKIGASDLRDEYQKFPQERSFGGKRDKYLSHQSWPLGVVEW